MKLVYLANIRMPSERANAVQIVHMCNAFAEAGDEVNLIATSRKTPIDVDPEEYYQTKFKFSLSKVYVPNIVAWGTIFFHLANLIFTIGALLKMRGLQFDIVYCRDETTLYLLSFFLPIHKMVYESHEARFTFPARKILQKGIKCIAISEGIKEFYVEQGVVEGQILVAHDGIDESFFDEVETKEESRKRLGIVTDKPVVMYIGGLDTWKGVETFFQASKHNDLVEFVVVGGRSDEVEKYGKQYPNVTFLGPRPYSELKHNQQAADVLVIPNTKKNELSAKYTSPLKLFTHLASKVPLIVSDIPSMRNVVSENEVTFFNPDDASDLAKEIDHVLHVKDFSNKKAHNAYKLSKRYTWGVRAKNILKFAGNTKDTHGST